MDKISCDCSIECAGDETEYFAIGIRKAKTNLKCCECHSEISEKNDYEQMLLRCYGYPWSGYSTCIVCANIRNRYCPYGFYVGQLGERLWECLGMDYITGEMDENFEEEQP